MGRVLDVKEFLQSKVLLRYLLLFYLFEYMLCVWKSALEIFIF